MVSSAQKYNLRQPSGLIVLCIDINKPRYNLEMAFGLAYIIHGYQRKKKYDLEIAFGLI